MGLSAEQYMTLMKPLNRGRIAKRSQGGKQLSYLESWDVRAHLIRVFGFGNFDIELLDYGFVDRRDYKHSDGVKDMTEVIWRARVQLTLRDTDGQTLARYVEAAVGSASGPVNMLGEHHDNAVKTAESDALKRCAINLGSQFGLSLYDGGATYEVVKGTLVKPEGVTEPEITEEQVKVLKESLGAVEVEQPEEVAG